MDECIKSILITCIWVTRIIWNKLKAKNQKSKCYKCLYKLANHLHLIHCQNHLFCVWPLWCDWPFLLLQNCLNIQRKLMYLLKQIKFYDFIYNIYLFIFNFTQTFSTSSCWSTWSSCFWICITCISSTWFRFCYDFFFFFLFFFIFIFIIIRFRFCFSFNFMRCN